MTFKALLVSTDETSIAALTPVLSGLDMGVESCDATTAIAELTTQKFDSVLVDFDDPSRASFVLQNVYLASPRGGPVTIGLVSDRDQVRRVFEAGANFVLFKPVDSGTAHTSLQAALALIKRERRRSLRVPVQVAVQLRVENGFDIEGILLDLSEDGLEVLSSQPLQPSASLALGFDLSGGGGQIRALATVVWASPNGQAGLRFEDLAPAMRETLRDWVSSHARRYNQDEFEAGIACQLTDLSEGGCYVETASPFPERCGVVLHLRTNQLEVEAQGTVRVMHPGFGMGVEFASSTANQKEEVSQFIRLLTSQPGAAPELTVVPRGLAEASDAAQIPQPEVETLEDPLLDLLRGHEALSQQEFLRQLQGQRHNAADLASHA
jgi:CheY-like chemotaxis protein